MLGLCWVHTDLSAEALTGPLPSVVESWDGPEPILRLAVIYWFLQLASVVLVSLVMGSLPVLAQASAGPPAHSEGPHLLLQACRKVWFPCHLKALGDQKLGLHCIWPPDSLRTSIPREQGHVRWHQAYQTAAPSPGDARCATSVEADHKSCSSPASLDLAGGLSLSLSLFISSLSYTHTQVGSWRWESLSWLLCSSFSHFLYLQKMVFIPLLYYILPAFKGKGASFSLVRQKLNCPKCNSAQVRNEEWRALPWPLNLLRKEMVWFLKNREFVSDQKEECWNQWSKLWEWR